ncbi:autotransporter outer membrane beta-barrel domain-containing protein [Pseudomonas frederiksbergensis]|uniref:Autotransporter outer membrane beta-barrel domain-containing protein n=1 Tax=Pseudomonas frederiksbergensis TaxID=104087 RepID=A0A1J0EE32_9PSED|nr:autotransporter outer membrane beta-barrel domain-containing protein [Pseudomonas frederiksbergensis]APC14362.1 autotransporter outer membrane beta-barrel domain-containing protein [Pseudomonas frederiksbergensis]
MNTALIQHEIKITLYTVSTSLLLCTSMEVQASPVEEQPIPWYQQDVPAFTLPTPDVTNNIRFTRNPGLDNQLLTVEQAAPSAWDRVYGQPARSAERDVLGSPFSGMTGAELKGPALITLQSSGGSTQRVGLVGGTNQFQGNGNGLLISSAIVDPNNTLNVQGPNLGAYWSLTGASGWHVDLTASGGRVNGYSLNDQGQRQAAEGSAMTLSVEGGFPIGISENWVIEPQAELINQRISLDTPYAGSGNTSSTDLTSWSGRVGASLKGSYDIKGLPIEPYVRTNFSHTVNTSDTVTLGQVDKLSSSRNSSSIELGLGLVARVTPSVSLYVSGDYSAATVANDLNGLMGSLGVQMRW